MCSFACEIDVRRRTAEGNLLLCGSMLALPFAAQVMHTLIEGFNGLKKEKDDLLLLSAAHAYPVFDDI